MEVHGRQSVGFPQLIRPTSLFANMWTGTTFTSLQSGALLPSLPCLSDIWAFVQAVTLCGLPVSFSGSWTAFYSSG